MTLLQGNSVLGAESALCKAEEVKHLGPLGQTPTPTPVLETWPAWEMREDTVTICEDNHLKRRKTIQNPTIRKLQVASRHFTKVRLECAASLCECKVLG